jgi:hypothetical protein
MHHGSKDRFVAETKQKKGSAAVSDDKIGKPFLGMVGNLHKCLVCEQLFTRQEAPGHSRVVCHPPERGASADHDDLAK